jgi:acyl dehydratase
MNSDFSFRHKITQKELAHFVKLTGDDHPLHTDVTYAQSRGFKTVVVHGMLISSFFSTLIGKYLPKQAYMYLSQTLTFHHPLYVGEWITVSGKIIFTSESNGLVTLKTTIYNENRELIVSGEARAKKIN